MARYRNGNQIIEAALFDGTLVGEPNGRGGVEFMTCPDWFPAVMPWSGNPSSMLRDQVKPGEILSCADGMLIGNRDETVLAKPGDFILQGARGDLLVCRPDIFAMTYERVAEA